MKTMILDSKFICPVCKEEYDYPLRVCVECSEELSAPPFENDVQKMAKKALQILFRTGSTCEDLDNFLTSLITNQFT